MQQLNIQDEQLVDYMIAGTKLKVNDVQRCRSQLAHLRKFWQRPVKRLAKETGLPDRCIRRFKAKKDVFK